MFKWSRASKKKHAKQPDAIFDQYETRSPHHQNAIDALGGWTSAFPPEFDLNAGSMHLYTDGRIERALASYGSIASKSVLEVGPLEGMHTYMLSLGNPAQIDAVEANRLCYLRCLVTKEVLKLHRAQFWLGDIQHWLNDNEKHYDLAIASGVLYHMADPGEFLRNLSKRADAIFIWTHFFSDAAMPKDDIRRSPFTGHVAMKTVAGLHLRYYERSYQNANISSSFCGGVKDRHFWMHRDDILALLRCLGFDSIEIQQEDPGHPGGPSFSLLARK
ncbi:class I SAM-dependent methyltransferase [Ensifer canadensis]